MIRATTIVLHLDLAGHECVNNGVYEDYYINLEDVIFNEVM